MGAMKIYKLDDGRSLEYVNLINTKPDDYQRINSYSQSYAMFTHNNMTFMWPTINGKSYLHPSGSYFRECPEHPAIRDANLDNNTTILFLGVLYLVDLKNNKQIVPAGFDESPGNPVFKYYNPWLITYPMRMVISGPDAYSTATKFCGAQHESRIFKDGDSAYIEYIPDWASRLVVPEESWEISDDTSP